MKKFFLLAVTAAFLVLSSCDKHEEEEHADHSAAEESALKKADPAGSYGKEIISGDTIPVSLILDNPEAYEGQTVLISGDVVDVCQKRGCWIEVASDRPDQIITVKVNDGEIVFPLSAKGRQAVVEGTVERIEMTREQAIKWKAHEAEERGEAFDSSSVQGPLTIWRIKGSGAEIKG